MDFVKIQLDKMKIKYTDIQPIRNKDGIYLFRIKSDNRIHVLKYFENEAYRREIENYRLLQSLHIHTMEIVSYTDCCLLLEDIEQSTSFRLGIEQDCNDVEIATKLATWYSILHKQGKTFVSENKTTLYDENDLITLENIDLIKTKTATENSPVWKDIEKNFDSIHVQIQKMERTLTYNDFYYTNLIVAKDKSSAYMFDYNLLGKGYAYADIRNVCSSLGEEAKKSFIHEYGECNPLEIIIDDVASVLITLFFACIWNDFPRYAEPYLNSIDNGFAKKVKTLLNYI